MITQTCYDNRVSTALKYEKPINIYAQLRFFYYDSVLHVSVFVKPRTLSPSIKIKLTWHCWKRMSKLSGYLTFYWVSSINNFLYVSMHRISIFYLGQSCINFLHNTKQILQFLCIEKSGKEQIFQLEDHMYISYKIMYSWELKISSAIIITNYCISILPNGPVRLLKNDQYRLSFCRHTQACHH